MAEHFDAPIPGQSLTNDPESPMPFETPPEFTDKNELTKKMFDTLTEPDSIEQIAGFLEKGASVEAITRILLFTGMAHGKFNTDMQLLMVEPVIYIILFIAERLGIKPVMEEDEYLNDDIEEEVSSLMEQPIENIQSKLPKSLLSKLDKLPKESGNGAV